MEKQSQIKIYKLFFVQTMVGSTRQLLTSGPSTPRTPYTPQLFVLAHAHRAPQTPLTPLTRLTRVSIKCRHDPSGSLRSISVNPQKEVETKVMSWFSARGIYECNLSEIKAEILRSSVKNLQIVKPPELSRSLNLRENVLIGRRFSNKLIVTV